MVVKKYKLFNSTLVQVDNCDLLSNISILCLTLYKLLRSVKKLFNRIN